MLVTSKRRLVEDVVRAAAHPQTAVDSMSPNVAKCDLWLRGVSMDKQVTARYFQITKTPKNGTTFHAALATAFGNVLPARERNVLGSVRIRLEDHMVRDGLVIGDFTRVQMDNLPGQVTDKGLDALPFAKIGHSAAFCYDPVCQVLMIQHANFLGVRRVCEYASLFAGSTAYSPFPVPAKQSLAQFESETPTKFRVRIASATHFGNEPGSGDFEKDLSGFAKDFEGHVVDITVSMGHAKGNLSAAKVAKTIKRLIGRREDGVQALEAMTRESDQPYDFIKTLLKSERMLNLPANDPSVARSARYDWITSEFKAQQQYLRTRHRQVPKN